MRKARTLIIILILLLLTVIVTLLLRNILAGSSSTAPTETAPENLVVTEVPTLPEPTALEATEPAPSESKPANAPTEATEEATEETAQPEETEQAVHSHSYSKATCTEPETCSCGKTSGSALGHRWQEATCQAPKTCTRCAVTEGEPGSHSYVDGTCSVCGDSQYADISLIEDKKYYAWKISDAESYDEDTGETICWKHLQLYYLIYSRSLSSWFEYFNEEEYEEGVNTAFQDAPSYVPSAGLSHNYSVPADFIYEGEYYYCVSGDAPQIRKSEIVNNRLVVPYAGEFALRKDGCLVVTESYHSGLPVGTVFSTDWRYPPGAEHVHNWQEATCQAPKTCTTCAVTEGELGDHSYVDGTCSVCGDSQYADISLIEGKRYHVWIPYEVDIYDWQEGNGEYIGTYKYLEAFSLIYVPSGENIAPEYEVGDNTGFGWGEYISSDNYANDSIVIYQGEHYYCVAGGPPRPTTSQIADNRLVVPGLGKFALQKDGYLVVTELFDGYAYYCNRLSVGTRLSTDPYEIVDKYDPE